MSPALTENIAPNGQQVVFFDALSTLKRRKRWHGLGYRPIERGARQR